MKIAALKEREKGELRAAISPETVKLYVKKGLAVSVEKNIGLASGFPDSSYIEAGAKVFSSPAEVLSGAGIILKIRPTPQEDEASEIKAAEKGAFVIGLISTIYDKEYLKGFSKLSLSALSIELLPRISRTQNMDVLSSQASLAGYRAVVEASHAFGRSFPQTMGAAGRIDPAKVLVLGVGVAGLQAIATAKRMGALVSAYDVRRATKEQVESLGAKFVTFDPGENAEGQGGYAKSLESSEEKKQGEFLSSIAKNYDIIITTAQIPGKKAPILVTKDMAASLRPGSVIVDCSTASGGNVEGSVRDEIVTNTSDVKIIGYSNLPSRLASDATKLFSRNLFNLVDFLYKDSKISMEDEIIRKLLIVDKGKIL